MKIIIFIFVLVILCSTEKSLAEKQINDEKNSEKIWAVLIAGTNKWENYRHQADICHSYHLLIQNGVKPEHIIVMMFDDIANNENNTYRGKIFNEPKGKDVYGGVKIDYSGHFVNSQTFLNVLKGNKSGNEGKGNGRVLESGPEDSVFVFYVSHGGIQILSMPDESYIHKNDLHEAFKFMSEKKMFKNMLFYLESCDSGSMLIDLDPTWNIYAVAASAESESSFATYCYTDNGLPCLGDLFSVNWMKDSETYDIKYETIGTQFDEVKRATTSSTVSEYGNRLIRSEIVATFQGFEQGCPEFNYSSNFNKDEIIDSREVELLMKEKFAYQSGFSKPHVSAIMKNYSNLRIQITDFVMEIVKAAVNENAEIGKVLTMKPSRYNQSKCHQKVIEVFNRCIPFGSNPYALRFSQIFANLCEILKTETTIIQNLNKKCQNGRPLFMGVI